MRIGLFIKLNVFLFITFLNLYPQDLEIRKYFNEDLFKRHLNFLGSDLFEGRAPGTLGGNLAAKYLALEFNKLKLKPISNENSYYQNIPFHSSKPRSSSELKIDTPDSTILFFLNNDFLLYQSGESVFFPRAVPLVFAGYGISAPEFNYDDYKDVNVEGKIVVFMEGEPISFDPSFFDANYPTIYSLPEAKQRIALSKGAKGTIILPLEIRNFEEYWETQVRNFSFEKLSLASSPSTTLDILLNPYNSNILFTGSEFSFDDIYDFHKNGQMRSFPLKVELTFKGDFQHKDFISPNIVGLLEGEDSEMKDRYIIVSAHYDHLGIGLAVNGDSIYNGVFDNAAGVAALLEIARMFSEKQIKNKRSIIFILTTAEENGLLGSYFYTNNPLVPLHKTIANINIDGIASFDEFNSVIGIGSEYSTLKVFLEETAKERNLVVTTIPPEFSVFNAFAKSDQHSFARAGIPSMLISDGLDYKNLSREEGIKKFIDYSINIYHSPFDDLNQDINYGAVAQHVEIISAVLKKLANDDVEPEWFNNSPYIDFRKYSMETKK